MGFDDILKGVAGLAFGYLEGQAKAASHNRNFSDSQRDDYSKFSANMGDLKHRVRGDYDDDKDDNDY